MSDYTIISIDDVENSAEASGLAPGLGARLRAKISHPGQEELLVIVKGDGRVKLDDDVNDVRERDVIRIGAGVTHGIEAGANGTRAHRIRGARSAPRRRRDGSGMVG